MGDHLGRYNSTLRRLGRSRGFALLGSRLAAPMDRMLHRLSNGKVHLAGSALPMLILHHTGARSGRSYSTPLAYLPRPDCVIVVASNWGQPRHPAWSWNLIARPAVSADIDGRIHTMIASQLDESAVAEVWPEVVAMWPGYDDYKARVPRDIRLFALRKATDVADPSQTVTKE